MDTKLIEFAIETTGGFGKKVVELTKRFARIHSHQHNTQFAASLTLIKHHITSRLFKQLQTKFYLKIFKI